MIRIDEIYYNVFLSALQDQPGVGLHWFDPFGSSDFANLCSMPKVNGIPARRYVFWDQEPLHQDRVGAFFDQFFHSYRGPVTLVTSEFNSDDVAWACDTYGLDQSYYFFHGWAALDWYRGYNHSYLYKNFEERTIEHTILCPNNIIGGKRKHRLALFAELVNRNLIDNNLISFPETCPYENKTVQELCHNYNIELGPVELPLRIDNGVDYQNNSHQIDMWNLANKSLVHVVTETVYYGNKQHITEKTFKPIVMQQPFILASCKHSLEYMKRYGFKTFSEFWDESYDSCDDNTRIIKIGSLLEDLNNMSVTERIQLQKAIAPIVKHNFDWFYSQEFQTLLWNEIQEMVATWR